LLKMADACVASVGALEANLCSLWSRFGRGDGCVLHEEADALWFDTPLPLPPYNAVLRFAASKDVDRRIDSLFEYYRRRDVPFVWMVHPTARPLDLDNRLRARDLQEVETCQGMSMRLDQLPDPDEPPHSIEIHEVAGEDHAGELLGLIAWRWNVASDMMAALQKITRAFEPGVPGSGVRGWIARKDGMPVAKVVLNLVANAAGIYGVATRPEARGHGLARLLTLQAPSRGAPRRV
jgi:ribosomal protein S18 acetylase RimI-like enzyme